MHSGDKHSCFMGLIFVLLQLLLDSGADVNYGTKDGWSPLHAANLPASTQHLGGGCTGLAPNH